MVGSKKLRMESMLARLEPGRQGVRERPRRQASVKYLLADVVKAALAMFVFKDPSLLALKGNCRHLPHSETAGNRVCAC